MPEVAIRAASLYVDGQKAAEFEGTEYNLLSGDEQQFGDPGAIGFSDGAITTTLTATGVHPVAGMSIPDLMTAMLNKQYLDIALALVNGHIHQVSMRCLTAKTTSHHKSGAQEGQYSFGGGQPSIT